MGVIMLYIIVQFSSDPYIGGSRIAFEMFGASIGFWLAVFAGIFLHPKLIPHPEQFMLGKKSSSFLTMKTSTMPSTTRPPAHPVRP